MRMTLTVHAARRRIVASTEDGSAEETRNPKRDLPRAVVGSVFIRYAKLKAVCAKGAEALSVRAAQLPDRGVFRAVFNSTMLYCGVSVVVTGMVLYSELDDKAPLSTAFRQYGLVWAEIIVSIGALLVRRRKKNGACIDPYGNYER